MAVSKDIAKLQDSMQSTQHSHVNHNSMCDCVTYPLCATSHLIRSSPVHRRNEGGAYHHHNHCQPTQCHPTSSSLYPPHSPKKCVRTPRRGSFLHCGVAHKRARYHADTASPPRVELVEGRGQPVHKEENSEQNRTESLCNSCCIHI